MAPPETQVFQDYQVQRETWALLVRLVAQASLDRRVIRDFLACLEPLVVLGLQVPLDYLSKGPKVT